MNNTYRWSISLGRWHGVSIRIHALFLLFAFTAAGFCVSSSVQRVAGHLWWTMIGGSIVLFVSVLVHELGHLSVARRVGFAPDRIVIGPLGGLSPWPPGPTAAYDVRWALGGLVTSLLVCFSCAAAITIAAPEVPLQPLFFRWHPVWWNQGPTTIVQWLEITLWINWAIFWINLLPAYPFDGERLYRGLLRQLRPQANGRQIADMVFWVGVISVSAMVSVAVMLGRQETDTVFPSWIALVLLAMVVLVSVTRGIGWHVPPAARVGQRTRLLQRSTVQSATRCHDTAPPCTEYRLANQVEPQETAGDGSDPQEDWERQEDCAVDEILVRVHANGLGSLNDDERAVLLRASVRYQSRIKRRP